jgi:hypothetical protein
LRGKGCEQWNVYISCDEYIVIAVDTSEYYRLSQSVWECESGGGHSARDRGDVF